MHGFTTGLSIILLLMGIWVSFQFGTHRNSAAMILGEYITIHSAINRYISLLGLPEQNTTVWVASTTEISFVPVPEAGSQVGCQ